MILPGKSHGQRSLVGYCLWGHTESYKTERLTLSVLGSFNDRVLNVHIDMLKYSIDMLTSLCLVLEHDGVITRLEPDNLECEVKWALGSITMN